MFVRPNRMLYALCTLVLASCGSASPTAKIASSTAPLSTESVKPADDHSLSGVGYVERGLPAADRPWHGRDYKTAAAALQKIAQADAKQLPRWRSPASGEVFARLTAEENLGLLANKNLTVVQRLQSMLDYLQGASQVLKTYVQLQRPDQPFDAELIELTVFLMKVVQIAFPLTDEYLASLPEQEAKSPARQQGLQQMRTGFAQTVDGIFVTFTEKQFYRVPQLYRLADQLQPILPKIIGNLPPLTQKEIPIRLRTLIAQESNPELKAALQGLLQAVQTKQ